MLKTSALATADSSMNISRVSRVNCRIVLLERKRRLVVVAISGVRVPSGGEFFTSNDGLPY